MRLLPKLFLWFFVANLLSLAITLVVVVPIWTNLQPHYNAKQQAAQAVDILQSGGKPAFRAWLRHRRAEGDGWGMLYRDSRTPVLGNPRRASPWQPQLNEMLAGTNELRLANGRRVVAASVTDAQGQSWRWVAAPRPPPKPPWTMLLIRTAIASLLLLIAAWWLARRLSLPIASLRATSRELAAGQLASRVPASVTSGKDEVAELGRDFNHMAARLQDSLESHRQLLGDVSHELRSPLGRLQLAVELARGTSGKVADDLLDRIAREGDRLETMIADVLTISRLDSANPKRQPLAIEPLLASLVSDAQFEAQAKNVLIHYQPREALPSFMADTELLRRGIENVLRNAVKYSPAGGEVQLSAYQQAENLLITITDQGPGVPAAELPRLFEPFYRVSAARDRDGSVLHAADSQGYGLGLAIAARAVEAHGGSVAASNVNKGGLCVSLKLPLSLASRNR